MFISEVLATLCQQDPSLQICWISLESTLPKYQPDNVSRVRFTEYDSTLQPRSERLDVYLHLLESAVVYWVSCPVVEGLTRGVVSSGLQIDLLFFCNPLKVNYKG